MLAFLKNMAAGALNRVRQGMSAGPSSPPPAVQLTPAQSRSQAFKLLTLWALWLIPLGIFLAMWHFSFLLSFWFGTLLFLVGNVQARKRLIRTHVVGDLDVGVLHLLGTPTRVECGPGVYTLAPGQKIVNVAANEKPYNPPDLKVVIRDDEEVTADGNFRARVTSALTYLTKGGEDAIVNLYLNFNSAIRTFLQAFEQSRGLGSMKSFLKGYLELPKDAVKINEFLIKLRAEVPKEVISDDSIEALRPQAGKFCHDAADWGFEITAVNVESVLAPEAVLQTAAKKAAARGQIEIRNMEAEGQKDQIKIFTEAGVTPDMAATIVSQNYGGNAELKHMVLSLSDQDKALSSPGVHALAGTLASLWNNGGRNNVRQSRPRGQRRG